MKKLGIFIFNLVIKCSHDQVFDRAAGLTLRVLLAFFPFLIFLMTLMGFLEIAVEPILAALYDTFPAEISKMLATFIMEISETRSGGLLSAALFFSVYNTLNGFRAVVRCINFAYGIRERRGGLSQIAVSLMLMLIFSAALIFMLAISVFGKQYSAFWVFAKQGLAFVVLFLLTSLIYKLACEKSLGARYIFHGAAFTVTAWLIIGTTFGYFTRSFTRFPMIYGSIAGVFLLIIWLNAVGVVLLIGNEINVMVGEFSEGVGNGDK
ncbi:MAG: YihY/virulence factor BrkB family protein [Defluviitaleaceae bacterium]|nr:YihY/virulence factor BrkB family protein [Defluviitaleaceae bacterium]